MRHVGNDIVDLIHAQRTPKSRDARFLRRVFCPEEESFLKADLQPEVMLWALWTGKEAAYKALQKDQEDIPAIPRLYKVHFEEGGEGGRSLRSGERLLCGSVSTPAGTVNLETLITCDYVHSIATSFSLFPDIGIVWKAERMPGDGLSSDESFYVRTAASRHLAQYLPGSNLRDIEIIRSKGRRGLGPPAVYVRKRPAAIDISLSHDGAYAAYAFTLAAKDRHNKA